MSSPGVSSMKPNLRQVLLLLVAEMTQLRLTLLWHLKVREDFAVIGTMYILKLNIIGMTAESNNFAVSSAVIKMSIELGGPTKM